MNSDNEVSKLAFVSSPRFVEHDTGPNHPERPDRLRAIHRAVRRAGLVVSADPFPAFDLEFGPSLAKHSGAPLVELAPRPAAESEILAAHSAAMLDRVRRGCAQAAVLDQSDTPTCPASFEIAMLSAGSAIAAADFVMSRPGRRAFSAARPPGHHAEHDTPMGFCLFNNIAIAARHLQQTHGLERIAIVDFDVHHGNGTQEIFEAKPGVLFVSIHEDPRVCYPGSGYAAERGVGGGEGFTLNVPMSSGSGDADYALAFEEQILPALEAYRPQVLMISAGFDAHADDPLAHVQLSDDAFEWMTRQLCESADAHCAGRVVSVLEGGYNLGALGRGVTRHLLALAK